MFVLYISDVCDAQKWVFFCKIVVYVLHNSDICVYNSDVCAVQ